ncbi:hypothetical protein ACFPIK_06605, partial [Algoriphagus aquatilis]
MENLSELNPYTRSPLGLSFWSFGKKGLTKLLVNTLVFLVGILLPFFGKSQNVPVIIPIGGIEMDGNLIANSPANTGDWFPGGIGSGGSVFNINGIAIDPAISFRFQDGFKNGPISDRIFSQGTKSSDDPNSWVWSNGDAGGKGDIGNAFLHIGTASDNDNWLVVASDRLVTNGTSYLEFEFFQNTVSRNTANNRFTSAGTSGGRTINDVLISIEYTNGGSAVTIKVYLWKQTPSGFAYVEETGIIGTDAFGFVNNVVVSAPLANLAFGTNSYQPLQFVEAAINISEIIGRSVDPCLGIKVNTLMVKTRSSASLTAAADDFIDPIPVRINFGTADVIYDSNLFCGHGTTVTPQVIGVQGGTFTSTAGLSIDSSTGVINLASSTPGTYTVTYSFTTQGCSKSVTTEVIVPRTAPAPDAQKFDFCQNSGNQTLSVVPESGYSIKWYDSNGNALAAAPTILTSTVGSQTYFVSQTKVGECESEKAEILVVVNATPSAPALSVPAPACDATSVTVTFSAATGVEYSLSNTFTTLITGGSFSAPVNSSGTVYARTVGTSCVISSPFTVAAAPVTPSAPALSVPAPACDATSVTVTFSAATGVEYSLSNTFTTLIT